VTGACPLCGCALECAGCYCHEDPGDTSYKAGAAAEREAIIGLAARVHASYPVSDSPLSVLRDFADLLRDPP
jgi:hypothetical protein